MGEGGAQFSLPLLDSVLQLLIERGGAVRETEYPHLPDAVPAGEASSQLLEYSGRQDSISTRIANVTALSPRISDSIGSRLLERERLLSPYAARSTTGRGRDVSEPRSPMRSEFQRDRDRIIHTNAFRRLKHKTQVFISPLGDHYATRLTHTLEVAQIARTIARALNLNEDLTEAIAVGHDLGHTPFGHLGEEELGKLHPGGFRHNRQSLRIVERLEKDGRGLNLTWETRRGILLHSKPRGDFLEAGLVEDLTLEGHICRLADAVAYLNHDLADAFRAGVLDRERMPSEVAEVLGETHAQRINAMVSDIIENSWAASGEAAPDSPSGPSITMGEEVRHAFNTLREFMFENVYLPEDDGPLGVAAAEIVRLLYSHFDRNRDEIPPEYGRRSETEDDAVVDFISGMTDRYAVRTAERIAPGVARPFMELAVI